MALLRFGQKKIMSMDDEAKSARLCKRYYNQTRKELLRSHQWNFATKRIALENTGDTPLYRWSNEYSLPADFIRAIEINQDDIWDSVRHFEIEENKLLTDKESVNLKYIFDEKDPTRFDALFVEAFSLKLAIKIVISLTGKMKMRQALMAEYEEITKELAQQIDATEERPVIVYQPTDSRLAQSRRQGGFYAPFPF